MNDDPIPLEQSDPVLAEHLRKIANGVHKEETQSREKRPMSLRQRPKV